MWLFMVEKARRLHFAVDKLGFSIFLKVPIPYGEGKHATSGRFVLVPKRGEKEIKIVILKFSICMHFKATKFLQRCS